MTVERNRGGRPSKFTTELGNEICRRIAEGESLRNICGDPEMPAAQTVNEWLATAEGKSDRMVFRVNYMAAREVQQHLYVDRALAVAEGREGPVVNPDEFDNSREYRTKVNENVQRDRLIVDTLHWTAERLLPKVYGRGMKLEHDVPAKTITVVLGRRPDEDSAP